MSLSPSPPRDREVLLGLPPETTWATFRTSMNGVRNGTLRKDPCGLSLVKYSLSPALLMIGSTSSYPELIGTPSDSGSVHLPSSHVPTKRETQMSALLQLKYIVRPSAVKVGSASRNAVLIADPMFTGCPCARGSCPAESGLPPA